MYVDTDLGKCVYVRTKTLRHVNFLFFSIIFNKCQKKKSVVTVADAHRPPEKVLVLINALALPGPLIGKNNAVCSSSSSSSSSSSKFLVCTPCTTP